MTMNASRLSKLIRPLLIAIGLCLLSGLAQAESAVGWKELSQDEQRILAPHQNDWGQLDPVTQQRLLRGARRWLTLSPEQRVAAARRFGEWQDLPDERREQIRQRYQAFRDLPPAQQRELKQSFERFRYLPPEQRELLRQRFLNMSPEERRGFLTGLKATREADHARNQWLQIAPEDRAATREMLQALTPPERQKLRSLMQGRDGEGRRQLHRQLLDMSIAERREFLSRQN